MSYKKTWSVIANALYEDFLNTRGGKRAMEKFNGGIDQVIERSFAPHLARVIRKDQYALLKEDAEIPRQLFSESAKRVLLKEYGDDEGIQMAVEAFRVAMSYQRKKLVLVNARLHSVYRGFGKGDEVTAVELVRARTTATVEMLIHSFCMEFLTSRHS